jgi:hypothetical protein
MKKQVVTGGSFDKEKIKRPGVHSKKKSSSLKGSKNYTKKYVGQGR